jgi:hypothetical protein
VKGKPDQAGAGNQFAARGVKPFVCAYGHHRRQGSTMRHTVVVILSVLLTACVTALPSGDAAPLYSIPTGSVLTLHTELTIPPGSARAAIQGGAVTTEADLDRYYPHCEFEVRTVADKPQIVAPGDFRIVRVVYNTENYGALPTRVADAGGYAAFTAADPSFVYLFYTELYLESAVQPNALRLTCGQVWDYALGSQPTIGEFKQAVGALVSLRAPARSG